MSKLPKGWRTVKLGEILTHEQCDTVCDMLRRPVTEQEKHKALVAYLNTFKDQIEDKGFEVEYLAYGLPFWLKIGLSPKPYDTDSVVDDIFRRN